MANILTTNPVQLDTVGATSAIARGLLISAIIWDSGGSGVAGNTCVIHSEAAGTNVIFSATLAVAKDVIIFAPAKSVYVTGLYLTTLANGLVLVYFS